MTRSATSTGGYRYAFAYYAFKTLSGYPKVLPGRPIPYVTLVYIVARYVRNAQVDQGTSRPVSRVLIPRGSDLRVLKEHAR